MSNPLIVVLSIWGAGDVRCVGLIVYTWSCFFDYFGMLQNQDDFPVAVVLGVSRSDH